MRRLDYRVQGQSAPHEEEAGRLGWWANTLLTFSARRDIAVNLRLAISSSTSNANFFCTINHAWSRLKLAPKNRIRIVYLDLYISSCSLQEAIEEAWYLVKTLQKVD
jgi:hypothetical protein